MHLSSFQYNPHLDASIFANQTVVVIDVFRATSVIATALAHGAKAIYAVDSVERALSLAKATYPSAILGGERKMIKPQGFHFGNSPQEYLDCLNQDILLTTTNGTAALQKTILSKTTITASFLNSKAVANELVKNHTDISILISGLRGEFSLEDGICAGKIIHLISDMVDASTDDFSYALLTLYLAYQHNIADALNRSSAHQRLTAHGFEKDIEFCKQEDIYNIVPFCTNIDDLIKITA